MGEGPRIDAVVIERGTAFPFQTGRTGANDPSDRQTLRRAAYSSLAAKKNLNQCLSLRSRYNEVLTVDLPDRPKPLVQEIENKQTPASDAR